MDEELKNIQSVAIHMNHHGYLKVELIEVNVERELILNLSTSNPVAQIIKSSSLDILQ